MASKLDSNEVVSLEEAMQTEMLINQALIDLLVFKGIITQKEFFVRIQDLRNGK